MLFPGNLNFQYLIRSTSFIYFSFFLLISISVYEYNCLLDKIGNEVNLAIFFNFPELYSVENFNFGEILFSFYLQNKQLPHGINDTNLLNTSTVLSCTVSQEISYRISQKYHDYLLEIQSAFSQNDLLKQSQNSNLVSIINRFLSTSYQHIE